MTVELIEKLYKNNLLELVLVELISSDNIYDIKSAEHSLIYLKEFENLIKQTSIPNKDKLYENIIKGIDIVERDLKDFKNAHIKHMLSDDWEGYEEIFVPEDECSKPFNTPKVL